MQATKNRVGRGRHHLSGLFVFLLIGAYAIFSLLLVLIGVRAYKGVVDTTERNGQVRITISYIANKVRAADGLISLAQADGYSVMSIRQADSYEGEYYETRIYYMTDPDTGEGGLYEQIALADESFDPELGELITHVHDFRIAQEGELLGLTLVEASGREHQMHLRTRTERPMFAGA